MHVSNKIVYLVEEERKAFAVFGRRVYMECSKKMNKK